MALTTTADRASGLAIRCESVGLEPVLLPCIEVVEAGGRDIESVRDEAAAADLIVITSSRAVAALWPDGGMPDVPVAAVGRFTAGAVGAAGGKTIHAGDGGSAALVELLSGEIHGRTVLFPHATGVGQSAVRSMEAAGATVLARPVYEIRPTAPDTDPVDAVVFGSSRAVDGWCLTRRLDEVVVGAIGETTAGAVAGRHATVHVVPPSPSFDDLIRLMAEHMSDRSAV